MLIEKAKWRIYPSLFVSKLEAVLKKGGIYVSLLCFTTLLAQTMKPATHTYVAVCNKTGVIQRNEATVISVTACSSLKKGYNKYILPCTLFHAVRFKKHKRRIYTSLVVTTRKKANDVYTRHYSFTSCLPQSVFFLGEMKTPRTKLGLCRNQMEPIRKVPAAGKHEGGRSLRGWLSPSMDSAFDFPSLWIVERWKLRTLYVAAFISLNRSGATF